MKKRMFCLLAVCFLFTGCGQNTMKNENTEELLMSARTEAEQVAEVSATKELFAMDTYMTITAYGDGADEAVEQAEKRIGELDAMLSIGSEQSEVSQLNTKRSANLSEDTYSLLQRSIDLCNKTKGAFHPLIYLLMEAWGFPAKEYQVPDQNTISELLNTMDISCITYEDDTRKAAFEKEGMAIDFGGIAKGYTSSQVMELLKSYGIKSGVVSLGGNVQVLGHKPDGSLWRVGIQNPDETKEFLGILETSDRAVITSGGYERYFEQDGVTYHHILDPATGYPADSGLQSVTIVSEDGTLADGLSTALFVMGLDDAEEFWRESDASFDMILLTDEEEIYITEGIEDAFSSDYAFHVLHK